jgi:hypothetical protein
LAALAGAYSVHEQIQVVQLPLKCAVGMFDEALYTAFYPNDIPALIAGDQFAGFCRLCAFHIALAANEAGTVFPGQLGSHRALERLHLWLGPGGDSGADTVVKS